MRRRLSVILAGAILAAATPAAAPTAPLIVGPLKLCKSPVLAIQRYRCPMV